jgi:hypothetical protein
MFAGRPAAAAEFSVAWRTRIATEKYDAVILVGPFAAHASR